MAGSFQEFEKANELLEQLEGIVGYSVTMRSAEVNGLTYQRVLVGPVLESEETDAMAALVAAGVTGGWILNNVEVDPFMLEPYKTSMSTRSSLPEITASPDRTVTQPKEYGPDDYNLARLKKKTGKDSWEDPRRRGF